METFVPNVEIKQYSSEYRDKVRNIVMNIKDYYPSIDEWLENELNKLDEGIDFCWIVINGRDDVVGVAITGLEKQNKKVAKLKTFYLSKEYSGYAIGVPLLKEVLNHWIKKRIQNIFVTFAEEEMDQLKGFFDNFGFLMDGMQPNFYRPGKTEYYMSKTFVYDNIDEDAFDNFIRNYLLRMRGIIPVSEGSEFLAHEDNKLSKTPRNVYIKITKDKETDSKRLFDYVENKINETKSLYGIIVSYYPLTETSDNQRIKVIDGYLLENMFFPLRLKRSGNSGIILPVYGRYAKELFHLEEPQRKIARKRLTLTHERAYFTGKDSFGGVSRGGTFLFYLTGGKQYGGIIGEAKIKILDTQGTEEAIKKYVSRGVIKTEEELRKHSYKGKVSIFLLTHVKTYPNKVGLGSMRDIIPGVKCVGYPVTDTQIDRIREFGGNDSYSY